MRQLSNERCSHTILLTLSRIKTNIALSYLSSCNWSRTQNHLVRKRTHNHFGQTMVDSLWNVSHVTRTYGLSHFLDFKTFIVTTWTRNLQTSSCISSFLPSQVKGTAWKVSKYGVFSGPYFHVFGLNTGKYGPEKTPYLGTFHTMKELA